MRGPAFIPPGDHPGRMHDAPPGVSAAPRSVLAVPAFRALFGSQVTSSLGAAISAVSVNWLVYHVTGSALDIAYVGLAGIVPGIVLGLLAGVVADRYNRRRLMITADVARLLAMGGLAAFLAVVGFALWFIIAVLVVVYSFSAMFTPAAQAIVPRLVSRSALEEANSLLIASTQLAQLFGAAAGGLIIAFAGAIAGIGINAVTFAVSAALLVQIAAAAGTPVDPGLSRPPSFFAQLREGLAYMRTHLPILEITLGFLPANFLITIVASFLVVFTGARFGPDPTAFGFLLAALSGGGVAGALLVGRWRPRAIAGLVMIAFLLLGGGAVFLLAAAPDLVVSLLAGALIGVSIGGITTVYLSTMQAIVPNEILARVLSIDSVGSLASIPGGLIAGGLLIARYGVTDAFFVAAVGLTANGLAMLGLRDVRTLGVPPASEGPHGPAVDGKPQ